MVFQQAAPTDAPAVLALYGAAAEAGQKNGTCDWGKGYPNESFVEEDLAAGGLYVLREGNTPIAAVSLLDSDDIDYEPIAWNYPDARTCILARLCVAPEYQRRGMGQYMMEQISLRAQSLGYEATRHLAARANTAACALYAKMGYAIVGRVHLYGADFNVCERLL